MRLEKKYVGMLLMFGCALIWSLTGVYVKLIPWSSLTLTAVQSPLSALGILIFLKANRMKMVFNWRSIAVALTVFFMQVPVYIAYSLAPAANVIALQYMEPVFLIIISVIFLKKKYKPRDYFVVVVTMLGIILFFLGDITLGYMMGNMFAIVSGISYALMYIALGETEDNRIKLTGYFLGFSMMSGLLLFTGLPKEPVALSAIFFIILFGLVLLPASNILICYAVESCPPLACSLIGALEIILLPLWTFLFANDIPTIYSLLGSGVIIVAILVWTILSAKKESA